jgi:cytochrome c biogenesis protein ResB
MPREAEAVVVMEVVAAMVAAMLAPVVTRHRLVAIQLLLQRVDRPVVLMNLHQQSQQVLLHLHGFLGGVVAALVRPNATRIKIKTVDNKSQWMYNSFIV